MESALKKRKHRPMVMVDIAVPRDIEPQVAELSDVYLYTVDDLRQIVDENKRARESEALKADDIIVAAAASWDAQLRDGRDQYRQGLPRQSGTAARCRA